MEMCASKSIPHTLKFAIFDTKDDDPWQCKIIIFYRKAIHKGESPSPRWGSQKPTSHMTRYDHGQGGFLRFLVSRRLVLVHLERSIVSLPHGPMVNVHSLRTGKSPSLKPVNQQVRCAMASSSQAVTNYQRVSFASGIHQPNRGQVVGTESIESMDLTDKSADQSSISWECSAHSKASYCVKSIPVIYEPWLIVIIRVTPPSKKQVN